MGAELAHNLPAALHTGLHPGVKGLDGLLTEEAEKL
jgi:hypothetical protein